MRIGMNGLVALGTLCLVAIMVFAITQQEFSWWVIPFGLLFSTIFAGVLAMCFSFYREDRFRRASINDYPNEPWMWDARWRSDIMSSRSKSEFWGTAAITVILGVFAFLGVASLIEGLPEGNLWVLLNLIPIAAAAYFGPKIYTASQNLRMEKQVRLINETRPAWVGESFSAIIETPTGVKANNVEAFLEHFKVVRTEELDATDFEKVSDFKLPAQIENIGDGRTRVSVKIPKDKPATSWSDDEQKRWWDLVVMTEVSGKPVTLRYEIPVADRALQQPAGA